MRASIDRRQRRAKPDPVQVPTTKAPVSWECAISQLKEPPMRLASWMTSKRVILPLPTSQMWRILPSMVMPVFLWR